MKPHESFLDDTRSMNIEFKTEIKNFFLDVEVKTSFASRDSNNDFHDMLCISNLIFKVSGNFSTRAYDHTTDTSRYMPGK